MKAKSFDQKTDNIMQENSGIVSDVDSTLINHPPPFSLI